MDIDELKDLLKRENRELEFKSTTSEIHKACRTLCAFLNGQGGVVLIGVKNDGRIVGQMVTDPTYQEIANDIRKIEPPANVDVSYISIGEDKFVIAMDVPAGDQDGVVMLSGIGFEIFHGNSDGHRRPSITLNQ